MRVVLVSGGVISGVGKGEFLVSLMHALLMKHHLDM